LTIALISRSTDDKNARQVARQTVAELLTHRADRP
jgi:hypothetical protein